MRTLGNWKIEGSLEHKTFSLLNADRFVCTVDNLTDAEYICKSVNNHEKLVKSLSDMMTWALQSVAKGDDTCDILPVGYEKWEKLLKELE